MEGKALTSGNGACFFLCLREEFVSIDECLLLNSEMPFLQTSFLRQGFALSDSWEIDVRHDR